MAVSRINQKLFRFTFSGRSLRLCGKGCLHKKHEIGEWSRKVSSWSIEKSIILAEIGTSHSITYTWRVVYWLYKLDRFISKPYFTYYLKAILHSQPRGTVFKDYLCNAMCLKNVRWCDASVDTECHRRVFLRNCSAVKASRSIHFSGCRYSMRNCDIHNDWMWVEVMSSFYCLAFEVE